MTDNAKLEVVRGQFGHKCVYLNDLRIAGEKPWGGGQTIHTFTICVEDERVRDAFMALWPEVAAERERLRATLAKVRGMVANSATPAIERLDVGACLRAIDEVLR